MFCNYLSLGESVVGESELHTSVLVKMTSLGVDDSAAERFTYSSEECDIFVSPAVVVALKCKNAVGIGTYDSDSFIFSLLYAGGRPL